VLNYVARIGWPAEPPATPSATVSWTAPDESGIDRYRVAWYTGGYFVNSTSVDHPTTTVSLYDLAPGTYEFFVTVIGTDGEEGMPTSVGTKVIS
jgi:hypothetical protein